MQTKSSEEARRGSSPLARGTLYSRQGTLNSWRLIPARAGNTQIHRQQHGPDPAHPRSRGEHSKAVAAMGAMLGSSPLARGTRFRASIPFFLTRLIPARAGNTGLLFTQTAAEAAHPRSRGEHSELSVAGAVRRGSSPLARGTRHYGGIDHD